MVYELEPTTLSFPTSTRPGFGWFLAPDPLVSQEIGCCSMDAQHCRKQEFCCWSVVL